MQQLGGAAAGPQVDPAAFAATVERVRGYVRSEPGSWAAFAELAHDDPVGTAGSLLALGAVLLDIAAGAFSLTPDEMLVKVEHSVELHRLEESRRADAC